MGGVGVSSAVVATRSTDPPFVNIPVHSSVPKGSERGIES